jgi:uncharacterized membrane protein YcaP (DUF421 family)
VPIESKEMKKENIHLNDIHRWLFGDTPPIFLLEVLIRTLITYIFFLFVMKWLGKRMNGQITIIEFVVMITLGAIISSPMQLADRGIAPAMIALLATLFFLKEINLWSFKNSKFEHLVQGYPNILVKDGILKLDEMETNRVSRAQLYGVLRAKQIRHLGMVKRVYIEACGLFTIYQNEKAVEGLSILPPDDKEIFCHQPKGVDFACTNCGKVEKVQPNQCSNCGEIRFENAIL